MEIKTAASAGFCFGVKRAVNLVYDNADKNNIYTFGPVIHNSEVMADIKQKGIIVLNSEEEILNAKKGTIIIRAHGAPIEIYDAIKKAGHELIDATCPFVLKIHNAVKKAAKLGQFIIIIGDAAHPEVIGIKSSAGEHSLVVADAKEAKNALEYIAKEQKTFKNLCIVAQTTFNYKKFQELVEIFRKNGYYIIDVVNTICEATEVRQREAAELAENVDAMIVIGDKSSSNTRKLYEICSSKCGNTYYIQTASDMDFSEIVSKGFGNVGITAGASTPNYIIEEVQTKCQI